MLPVHSNSQKYCAVTAIGLLVASLVQNGWTQGPFFPPMAAIATGVAAGGAATGGIQICADTGDAKHYVTHVAFDARSHRLTATLNAGERVSVPIDGSDLAELARVALSGKKSCVDVSIDPVADKTEEFFSTELAVAPVVTRAWLDLDGNIGSYLEGGFGERGIPGSVASPISEAKRLLKEDAVYRQFALRYYTAPATWHHTEVKVDPFASGEVAAKVQIEPTPISLTPDGRRFHLVDGDKAMAARPYVPLVHAIENNPEAFIDRIAGLDEGLDYARTFGVLTACAQAPKGGCSKDLEGLEKTLGRPEEPSLFSSEDAALSQAVTSLVRRSVLQTVWQEYRLGIDPRSLSAHQRVAIFVDEAIGNYSDLEKAGVQAKNGGMAAEKLLAWVDGIDLSKQEYGGWAELGKFTAGVWAARPVAELNGDLRRAYAWAEAKHDRPLEYETLKAAQQLAPVMASNWTIAKRRGTSAAQIDAAFDPRTAPDSAPRRMEAGAYLSYLPEISSTAIKAYVSTESVRMQKEIANLGKSASLTGALQAMANFQNSRLPREKVLMPDGDLIRMEGELHYAIAKAAIAGNQPKEARDRLRMLKSLKSAADDADGASGEIENMVTSLERELADSGGVKGR